MNSTLKFYTIGIALVSLVVIVSYNLNHRPKTVTLAEDRWACGDTTPRGIEAFCTNYIYRPTLNEKLAARAP